MCRNWRESRRNQRFRSILPSIGRSHRGAVAQRPRRVEPTRGSGRSRDRLSRSSTKGGCRSSRRSNSPRLHSKKKPPHCGGIVSNPPEGAAAAATARTVQAPKAAAAAAAAQTAPGSIQRKSPRTAGASCRNHQRERPQPRPLEPFKHQRRLPQQPPLKQPPAPFKEKAPALRGPISLNGAGGIRTPVPIRPLHRVYERVRDFNLVRGIRSRRAPTPDQPDCCLVPRRPGGALEPARFFARADLIGRRVHSTSLVLGSESVLRVGSCCFASFLRGLDAPRLATMDRVRPVEASRPRL
jgi:hypothetical protein